MKNIKTAFLLFFVLFSGAVGLFAQTENKDFETAEDFLAKEQFAAALPLYIHLLNGDSSNATLNFKIGICYLNSRSQKTKAVYYLNKAIEPTTSYYTQGTKTQSTTPVMPQTLLGPSHLSYDLEKVNEASEKLKKITQEVKDKELSVIQVLDLKMELKKIGDELREYNDSPINFKIETSNQNTTSSYVGYSSVLSADKASLIFNFQKPESKWEENNDEKQFFEEPIRKSRDNIDSAAIENQIGQQNLIASSGKDDTHKIEKEVTVAVSEDNQVILTYKNTKGDGNLYLSRLNGNNWTTPEKLSKIINTKGWEPNECISADGVWLYFTSSRKGGYGGEDIYRSRKLPNGEWSKAANLGPEINTAFDDVAPFILPGGNTLYYSSNGRNDSAQFDIYTSRLDANDAWTVPLKVGYPVSVKTDENPIATSKTNESSGTFVFTFKNKNEAPIRVVNGRVVDTAGNGIERIKIKVIDNETSEQVSFSSTGDNGNYSFILPTGKDKNVTFLAEGCLFQSENINTSAKNSCYQKTSDVKMCAIAPGSKIILKNVFFDSAKATLSPLSHPELEHVFHLLQENSGLVIEISDYMTSPENAKVNKVLSQQRAQAVQEYLLKKGISTERISARGYVKYKPKTQEKRTPKKEMAGTLEPDWIELNVTEKKNS